MTGPAAVAEYTTRLARLLLGPPARRAAILDEVTDGLLSAAEAHTAACSDAEEAARRAVAEWGPPDQVAAAYNDATLRLRAGRASLLTVGLLPLLGAGYAAALLSGPRGPWSHHPPGLLIGIAVLGFGAVLCAAGGLTGLRRGGGLAAAGTERDAAVVSGAYAALSGMLCVLAALIGLLAHRGLGHPGSLNWPAVAAPAAVTLVALVYFGLALRRLLAVARTATAAATGTGATAATAAPAVGTAAGPSADTVDTRAGGSR